MTLLKGAPLHKNSFGYGTAKIAGFLMIFGGGGRFLFHLYVLFFGGEPDIDRIPWAALVGFAMVVQAGFSLLVWEPPGTPGSLDCLQKGVVYHVLHQSWQDFEVRTDRVFPILTALVTSRMPPTRESVAFVQVDDRKGALPSTFEVVRSKATGHRPRAIAVHQSE